LPSNKPCRRKNTISSIKPPQPARQAAKWTI
jgi:hypothetical protein